MVLLNVGEIIETASWKDQADAILLIGQPGQEAGNSVADLLSGKVTPSGKLAATFPVKLSDVPSTKNFPGKVLDPQAKPPKNPLEGIPSEEIYEEGIYVGYRYFKSFDTPVSFPFGYGLSYTTFEYSDLQVKKENDTINLSFKITNTGKTKGKEVAQLYSAAPKGEVEKPALELKAFQKTHLLEPGESEIVQISVPESDLGYYDTASSSWKLDPGTYRFLIGKNVDEILFNAEVELNGRVIEKTKNLLVPQQKIDELKRE